MTNGLDTALGFGDTVLVLGVGPLGLMHLAKAEMLGAGRLIAIDVLPERLEHARAFGADMALDASATTADERRGQVREATGGLGADVVVDCSGRAETFPEALGLVRPGGTVVEAGAFVDLGPVPVNPNRDVCSPGVAILGIGGETLPQYAPALRMLARHAGRLPFARADHPQRRPGGCRRRARDRPDGRGDEDARRPERRRHLKARLARRVRSGRVG